MATCIKHRITLDNIVGDEEMCVECIAEASAKSLRNFGEPECVYCPDCGMRFNDIAYFYMQHVPCESASC